MTILYTYYNQPGAIDLFEKLGYPDFDLNFIFVDDGSTDPLRLGWKNARIFRIDEDIPWNMPAANNLGFLHASGKVLRMDIDHYITKDQVHELKVMDVGRGTVMKFPRLLVSESEVKEKTEAQNIYLINADDYHRVGGYDEMFCGNYGYEDKDIMIRFSKAGYDILTGDTRIYVDDRLSTRGLDRDTAVNWEKYRMKWG